MLDSGLTIVELFGIKFLATTIYHYILRDNYIFLVEYYNPIIIIENMSWSSGYSLDEDDFHLSYSAWENWVRIMVGAAHPQPLVNQVQLR